MPRARIPPSDPGACRKKGDNIRIPILSPQMVLFSFGFGKSLFFDRLVFAEHTYRVVFREITARSPRFAPLVDTSSIRSPSDLFAPYLLSFSGFIIPHLPKISRGFPKIKRTKFFKTILKFIGFYAIINKLCEFKKPSVSGVPEADGFFRMRNPRERGLTVLPPHRAQTARCRGRHRTLSFRAVPRACPVRPQNRDSSR